MNKQKNNTFKVWLEIERYDEQTGDGKTMDAPGCSLATFDTYAEAWDFADRITRVAEAINIEP